MDARAFFAAIVRGDEEDARRRLEAEPALARATAPREWAPEAGNAHVDDWSPVQAAIEHGLEPLALALLDAGADIDHRHSGGRGPAHDAFEYGAHRVLDRVLAEGATVDAALAAGLGRLDRLEELLAQDPALAEDLATDLEPMGWASYGDQPAVIDRLVAAGAPVHGAHLRMAASCGHEDAALALIRHGVDPSDAHPDTGATALHVAAAMQFSTCTEPFAAALIEAGADVEKVDAQGRTALDVARAGLAEAADDPPRADALRGMIARLELGSGRD